MDGDEHFGVGYGHLDFEKFGCSLGGRKESYGMGALEYRKGIETAKAGIILQSST